MATSKLKPHLTSSGSDLHLVDQVRLLYVGMTRAKSQLLITSSGATVFTQRLVELVAP
jgi:superfamily I DNA/RNA helicase